MSLNKVPMTDPSRPIKAEERVEALGQDQDLTVLLLPGWQGSGPDHWQMRWAKVHGYSVVEQNDWLRPQIGRAHV